MSDPDPRRRPPTLDNIERIEVGDPAAIERDHLSAGRPVLFADFAARGSADKLRSEAGAVAVSGGARLHVQRNYLEAIIAGGTRSPTRTTTLGDFLAHLAQSPDDEVCIEFATPDELLERLPLPPTWNLGHDPNDALSHTFVAAAGNYTHLHYDDDQRHVLLHQVFGAKRVVVIHPRETHKLDPMAEPGVQRCSGVLLHKMDNDDKLAFLRYANAWDCVVEPGETLAIPAMAWHYVEYLNTALSVSWRLPRSRVRRRLGDLLMNPTTDVQRVAAGLAEGEIDDVAAAQIVAAVDAAGPDPGAMAATAASICRRIWATTYRDEQRYGLRDVVRPKPVPRDVAGLTAGAVARLHPGVEVAVTVGAAPAVLITAEGGLVARLDRDWVGTTLELMAAERDGIELAELAELAGSELSDLAGLLVTLADRGWVAVDEPHRPA